MHVYVPPAVHLVWAFRILFYSGAFPHQDTLCLSLVSDLHACFPAMLLSLCMLVTVLGQLLNACASIAVTAAVHSVSAFTTHNHGAQRRVY